MSRLYRYRGTVAAMDAWDQAAHEIVLHNSSDDSKAPTRLNIYGDLAKYIYELEMTDAEERYLDADYVYDWTSPLSASRYLARCLISQQKSSRSRNSQGTVSSFSARKNISTPRSRSPWTRNNALRGSNGKMTITHEEEKANENLCLFLRGARPPVHRYRR